MDSSQAVLYAITLQLEDRNPNYKGVDEEADAAKANHDATAPYITRANERQFHLDMGFLLAEILGRSQYPSAL